MTDVMEIDDMLGQNEAQQCWMYIQKCCTKVLGQHIELEQRNRELNKVRFRNLTPRPC